MTTAMVCARLRAQPVDRLLRPAAGGYMELLYDPAMPYEVRLTELGYNPGEIRFARDLLESALGGEPAGEGAVRVRLAHPRGSRHAMVLVGAGVPGEWSEFALTDTRVREFLNDTYDLVPAGQEWRYIDVDAVVAHLTSGGAA